MNKYYIFGSVGIVILIVVLVSGHNEDKKVCANKVSFYGQSGSGYYMIDGDLSTRPERYESRDSAIAECMRKR